MPSARMNQVNGGDDLGATGNTTERRPRVAAAPGSSAGCVGMRDSTVWMRHSQLGMVKVGHGSTATDNLVLIDLGGMAGASTPDVALYNGGFLLRAHQWRPGLHCRTARHGHNAIRGLILGHDRRNHVLYETPTLAGFTVQAAVAEDNYWDVALRYAGEFGGFRLAFGIGYQEDTEFNWRLQIGAPSGAGPAILTGVDAGLRTAKESEMKGSASILHVPTGLFVTGAAGNA